MNETNRVIPADPPRRIPGSGFWRKTWAVLIKEFIQLKRDRVSFAMIIMIPLVQLLLFGYAINTTPRDLPTAVLLQETSDLSRSILAALKNTRYFKITQLPRNEAELDQLGPDVVHRLVADPAQDEVLLHGRAGVAAAVVAHDLTEATELLRGQVAAVDLHLDGGEALLLLRLHVGGDEALEGLAVAVR